MNSIEIELCLADTTEFFDGRATLHPIAMRAELRGSLVPFGFDELPFTPQHSFLVRDVPAGTVRGQHAVMNADLFLVCLSGKLRVTLRDRSIVETIMMDRPDRGLRVGAGLWNAQTYLTDETMMLAFASNTYAAFQYSPEPLA